jgi:hypothetical protein
MLRLFLDHAKSILVFVFACTPSLETALLLKEVLVLIVDLGVVFAFSTSHVLFLLRAGHIFVVDITISVSELTIVSLISSEICGIEHSDALIEISLILFRGHRALASLLDYASAIAIGRHKVTAYFGVDIVGVIVIEHLMIRVHSIIILLLLFAI